jgi:hypothetical protein
MEVLERGLMPLNAWFNHITWQMIEADAEGKKKIEAALAAEGYKMVREPMSWVFTKL